MYLMIKLKILFSIYIFLKFGFGNVNGRGRLNLSQDIKNIVCFLLDFNSEIKIINNKKISIYVD